MDPVPHRTGVLTPAPSPGLAPTAAPAPPPPAGPPATGTPPRRPRPVQRGRAGATPGEDSLDASLPAALLELLPRAAGARIIPTDPRRLSDERLRPFLAFGHDRGRLPRRFRPCLAGGAL